MHFNDDMKRRAGLLVWAFALLSAGWMVVQAGNRPPPPTREQRVEAGFDALRQRPRQAPLALLGDSITAGHIWGGSPTCLAPINLAVSGVVSSDLLEGLTLLEATGARQVLVMVGINDLRYGIAPEQLLDNYRALLDRLRLAGVTPVLQSTLRVTPMHEHHPILNSQVVQVNAQLQAWAREEGWQYVDVQAVLQSRDYRADGLHLTASGYRAWERLLQPILCPASEQTGESHQPPGEDEHLHQQAGKTQPDEQAAGAGQMHQRLEQSSTQ